MMKMRSVFFLVVASALALSAVGCAASDAEGDETGIGEDNLTSQDRSAIMDALRAEVKPTVNNQDIVFNVQGDSGMFGVKDGYCWLQGVVQLRNGGEPSTAGTDFQDFFDGWHVQALLKKEGNSWKVLRHA